MTFIRKLFFCIFAASLMWVGVFTFNQLNDGFSIHQMSSSLGPCPHFAVSLPTHQKEQLQKALDQKFYYIGKGCQFYVFESEDGKLVLKFLKHKHLRPFSWLLNIPMPQQWRLACTEKIARRVERVNKLFSSCKLAYEKIPEETGVLYIHLNRTPALEKEVVLIDKLGLKHRINVDEYEFIIQKKGMTIKEAFNTISNEEIQPKIEQLVNLVLARCQKGIGDRDQAFSQNVAFLNDEERAIVIDIGQLYENPALMEKEEQAKELAKRLSALYSWTEEKFPQLVSFL